MESQDLQDAHYREPDCGSRDRVIPIVVPADRRVETRLVDQNLVGKRAKTSITSWTPSWENPFGTTTVEYTGEICAVKTTGSRVYCYLQCPHATICQSLDSIVFVD